MTSKAQLTINETDTIELEGDQLLLTTVRSHDQYNTISYGLDDRYRGVRGGRRVIFIRKEDLIQRGLNLNDEDLKEVMQQITRLNPKPGGNVGEINKAESYVVPDFFIFNNAKLLARGSK